MTGAYSRNKGKRAEYWQRYAAKRRAAKVRPEPPDGVWKDIPNSWLAVSVDGRVWSYRGAGKILAGALSRDGYRKVSVNGKPAFVHRLVGAAFVPGEGEQLRHLDGNKLNNHAGNLAWGTCKENIADKWAHGKMVVGERHHNNRIPESEIPAIRASKETNTALGKKYGVSRTAIYLIRKGHNYGWLK